LAARKRLTEPAQNQADTAVDAQGSQRRAQRKVSASPDDTEALQFYGQRIALYAKLLTKVFGGLYVAGIVLTLTLAPHLFWQLHTHPAKIVNLIEAVFAALIWRLAKRPDQPRWLLMACDFGLPLSVTLAAAAVSPSAGDMLGFELILMFVLLMVVALVFRAALVPSPPERTTLIAWLTGAPVLVASYWVAAASAHLPTYVTPLVAVAAIGIWTLLIAFATRLISREIYGLQRAIRNARRLGQYTLLELVGEGGMGAVYRAQHALLRRPTAVKLLLPERAGPENIARFEREVQHTSMLTHPNTIAIYDFGRSADNVFYYAMEFLDGISLQELVEVYGPQPPARVLHILLQASDALTEAHGIELIHRDIKPANILLCERGGAPDVVKLLDFGLVKDLSRNADASLTHAGALTGTPLYLAPETIANPDQVDHRVDIYALGAVGYYLLAGVPVFEGSSVIEVCGHHLHTPPIPPSTRLGTSLPLDLEELILRCLAKSPSDRPRTASELHDSLLNCAASGGWSARTARSWWKEHRQNDVRPRPAPKSDIGSAQTESFSRTLHIMR
jgi:serine/threonine-protein kinase